MRTWEELSHLQKIPQKIVVELKLELTQEGMIQQILYTCASIIRSDVKSPGMCKWL